VKDPETTGHETIVKYDMQVALEQGFTQTLISISIQQKLAIYGKKFFQFVHAE